MLDKAVGRMSQASNPLARLVGPQTSARFVGFTLHSTYSDFTVMTNDVWRERCNGLPMNGYLLATSLDPEKVPAAAEIDRRVVLLRITGRSEIGTDRESQRAIMEHFQANPDTNSPTLEEMEPISRGMLQWSGIATKVLGTFYLADGTELSLGADVEDFFAARHMKVYKPAADALGMIVNFVDPVRRRKSVEDAKAQGMKGTPTPFQIGTVRFTSSSHMSARDGVGGVAVNVFPGDFLARRTAVFGMTRTGKSNTTKAMVSAVALSAFETDLPVGQLVFDINGEYSNANNQDQGSSLHEVFADNTVRYRALDTEGFRDVRVNFYESTDLGLTFIGSNLRDTGGALSDDLQTFASLDLAQPNPADHSAHTRWARQRAIYQCILHRSGFAPAPGFKVVFDVGKEAMQALYDHHPVVASEYPAAKATDRPASVAAFFELEARGGGSYAGSPEAAATFWEAVREVEFALEGHKNTTQGIRGSKGKKWLNALEIALLSVLVGKSSKTDGPIRSSNAIRNAAVQFHSPRGSADVGKDIYDLLEKGRIVIVDLSVGPPSVREKMAERIARKVFDLSSDRFVAGRVPPRIVLYAEEAHNLIGKRADLDTTWPRIAKEGAKYGIALVYATQEPSSIHPNILSNTENLFVTHLNNDGEIRALAGYYDFGDFAESLKRCQDVGFARVKTLSSNFITPTQVLKFSPDSLLAKYEEVKKRGTSWFSPLPPDSPELSGRAA